jgi:hypothetical protein
LFYGGFVLFWTVAILILIGWNDDGR